MTPAPTVKGWCPGAYRPMMSGDGLVVRVRPFFARLTADQVRGLCDTALNYGNGFIDLTSRANLQIRGVAEGDHEQVLLALRDLRLLDDSPQTEARRNILITPLWRPGDISHRIAGDLLGALAHLPDLPAKFGFAVDTGAAPLLQDASADIRVERVASGLSVRADGAEAGRSVRPNGLVSAISEVIAWFLQRRTDGERRLAQTVRRVGLPAKWETTTKQPPGLRPAPGLHPMGCLAGIAFGQVDARALQRVMTGSKAQALRVTPWRMVLLEGASDVVDAEFISRPGSPLLTAHACPGAPFCTSATVKTRALARRLAAETPGSVHVSGCAKSCAYRKPANLTLIGRDGRFDLVRDGHPWDAPHKTGLRPEEILAELKTHV
ncbi:precorrin-3B synthase [uncultured Roseobacter sp.]|uniref:precorrin-3B synthase n=1 Tax=uncultured Roseobacter sp. TaxID=114847 RepID=UPI002602C9E5|nr:precorrin-3B synthase [uncultured Roseobacter sp.]